MSDDNNNQIEFWNGEAGLKWVREQEKMDLMLNPLSDIAIDHAQPQLDESCLLYTSPSPRDRTRSRMPSSA